MKNILFFTFSFSFLLTFCQRKIYINLDSLRFDNSKLFIICKGTKLKSGIIAHRFNISDTNITHVAIGLIINDSLRIFHVSDTYINPSAFSICTLNEFIQSEDVYYLSIWQAEISKEELSIATKVCNGYTSRKIIFDAFFNLNNRDTLYCSEFCVNVLQAVNSERFCYQPVSIQLNNKLYEAVLEKKKLNYYPVDFFESNKTFKKNFESHF